MKKMKKIFAMLLALTMVLGMTMTASAATAATITVKGLPLVVEDNPSTVEDESVTVAVTYMQVVTPDRDNVTGWEFTSSQYANAFKSAFSVATDNEAIEALIKLGKLENLNQYAVSGTINADATDFADALKLITTTNPATNSGNGEWTINATAAGLYVINADATGYTYIPMAAYVSYNEAVTGLNDVEVTVKGSEEKITKVIDNTDDKSVSAGDEVEFTATTEYPFYGADVVETETTFVITDDLTNGAFVRESVEVKVGTKTLQKDTDYTIQFTTDTTAKTDQFVITFVYKDALAGDDVEIKYSAIVAEGSEDVVNTIKSTFDPDGDSVTLDKIQVTVIKVDDQNTTVKLGGAEFEIYEAVRAATEGYDTKTSVSVMEHGETVATIKTLYLKKVAEGTTSTETETLGTVVFDGLDAQKTYYIKETNAPEGYSLNDSYYGLNIPKETTTNDSKTYVFENFADTTVKDTKLIALPSTGGIGTTIFTVAGCGIMIAAAFFFFASRKKEN